jgi:hypothetical protein
MTIALEVRTGSSANLLTMAMSGFRFEAPVFRISIKALGFQNWFSVPVFWFLVLPPFPRHLHGVQNMA